MPIKTKLTFSLLHLHFPGEPGLASFPVVFLQEENFWGYVAQIFMSQMIFLSLISPKGKLIYLFTAEHFLPAQPYHYH